MYILAFGVLCAVLSAIYYKICAAINAFLSSFWIVSLIMLLLAHSSEPSIIFIVAAIISSLIGYIAYKVYEISYILLTAFSGALVANIGLYGVIHNVDFEETMFGFLYSSSDMYTEIILGTLVLGIIGFFVQRYRLRGTHDNNSNGNQGEETPPSEPIKDRQEDYIKVSKFRQTGIEKDAALLAIPVIAFLVMPFWLTHYGYSYSYDPEAYQVLYWIQMIFEVAAIVGLVYATLVKTPRFGLIYGLVHSTCFCLLNITGLGYYTFWPLLVLALRMVLIWAVMYIIARIVPNDGIKPLLLLLVGLFMHFYVIDWLAYLYVYFYFYRDRGIQILIGLVLLYLLFKYKVDVNIFSPSSAYEKVKSQPIQV